MKKSPKTSLIHEAVMIKDVNAVRRAIEEGENVDSRDVEGRTALFYAIQDGNLDIATELIGSGADVNAQDKNLETPLHFAARAFNPDATKLLLDNGAKVDALDSNGNTPLSTAVFESRGRGSVIELLTQSGADKNLKNNYGVSPSDLAQSIANYDVKKFLL
jgi:uncharacterized protein